MLQVIKVFTCDVLELPEYFADAKYEPPWGAEPPERRQCLLQPLVRVLCSENRSLAQYEAAAPGIDMLNLRRCPQRAWQQRRALARKDQRAAIDLCLSRFTLPELDKPELLALRGRPGCGKSFVLNTTLSRRVTAARRMRRAHTHPRSPSPSKAATACTSISARRVTSPTSRLRST